MAQQQVKPEDYTGPTEFVHLHNHTVFSTLDGVATPEQYAEQCKKRGYPAMSATEHGHLASVPDFYLAFKKQKVKPIFGCFLPGQRVLTPHGIKLINELEPNDEVITDKNRARRVLNVQTRAYAGEVVRLKAWGVEEIVATPEHPFLMREVTRQEIIKGRWSETITIGMRPINIVVREKYWRTYTTKRSRDRTNKRHYRFYLCVPRLPDGSRSPLIVTKWLNADRFEIGKTVCAISNDKLNRTRFTDTRLPPALLLDDDLLWIMGLWLAEGTAEYGRLNFWLGADEFHFYQRIADYFAQFRITTGYSFRTDRAALDVWVNSVYVSDLFANIFQKGYANKRIPWWLIDDLDIAGTKALIDGIFDGDAKPGEQQLYLKLNNESLVWQVRLLMTRLGQYSAITPLACNNSDNMSYVVRRRESGRFYYDYDDRYIYLPVFSVEREHYDGPVYNLEVEEDHTYNVGVAVHNCEIYYNDWDLRRQEIEAAGTKVRSPAWRKDNPIEADRILRNRHLTVLCKNRTGLENLIKLTTQAYSTGLFGVSRKQFNRIWFEKLCEFKEGLIILSGCLNGPVCHELRFKELRNKAGELLLERTLMERVDAADKYIKKFKNVFGDDYKMEVQMPGVADDVFAFRMSVALADRHHLDLTLANDCHYLDRKDFLIQKVMMATAQETTVDSPDLFHVNSDEQYMKTRAELWARFKNFGYSEGIPDSVFEKMCDNTLKVADQVESFDFDADPKIPSIANEDSELRKLVAVQLHETGLDRCTKKFIIDGKAVTYVDQAKIELKRFIDKGFSSYFLITRDLIQYGRRQGWPFSPRGSAGGSLVCFLLGIHVLDPLLWGLSFDRFLSPSRGGYMLNLAMGEEIKGLA